MANLASPLSAQLDAALFEPRPRAHGLIRKVSGTHRYQVTASGWAIITALLAARQADVEKLIALAA